MPPFRDMTWAARRYGVIFKSIKTGRRNPSTKYQMSVGLIANLWTFLGHFRGFRVDCRVSRVGGGRNLMYLDNNYERNELLYEERALID